MKSKMEHRMETFEGKVTHTIEEVTRWIGRVEETVQKLQEGVDKLHEKSLKQILVASTNACSNIKPPVRQQETVWSCCLGE